MTTQQDLADRLEKAIDAIRDAPRRFFDLAMIIETSKIYDPIPFLRISGERYTKTVAELGEILAALRAFAPAEMGEVEIAHERDRAKRMAARQSGENLPDIYMRVDQEMEAAHHGRTPSGETGEEAES